MAGQKSRWRGSALRIFAEATIICGVPALLGIGHSRLRNGPSRVAGLAKGDDKLGRSRVGLWSTEALSFFPKPVDLTGFLWHQSRRVAYLSNHKKGSAR